MKKLSQFSVNYPITILMAVMAVVLLGFISFTNLSIDLFPDLNNPRIFIEIKAGERPPEEMERQFVENIESIAVRQKKSYRYFIYLQSGCSTNNRRICLGCRYG